MYTAIVNDTCLNIEKPKIGEKTVEKFNFLIVILLICSLPVSNSYPVNFIPGKLRDSTNIFYRIKKYIVFAENADTAY